MKKKFQSASGFIIVLTVVTAALFFSDPYVSEFIPSLLSLYAKGAYGECVLALLFELLAMSAIAAGLLQTNRILRMATCMLVPTLAAFHSAYAAVLKRPLQLFDFGLMERESAHTVDALQTYQDVFLPKLMIFFALLAVFIAIVTLSKPRIRKSFFALVVLTFAIEFHFMRAPDNAQLIAPSVFTVPMLYLKNAFSGHYFGPRDKVFMTPSRPGASKNIIFIVDESMRGDMLSLNGYTADTTPGLKKLPILNFGIAAATTNCSSPSHLVLRTGLRADQLPNATSLPFKLPSIFQYAQQAGYKTFLIEGQRLGGALQDFLSRYDLDAVNAFHFLNKRPKCGKSGDCFVVEEIVKALRSAEPVFIFAVKEGAHVPYQKNYPKIREIFRPALDDSEGIGDRTRTLNSYYNTVRWMLDDFFLDLLPQIDGQDYLLLYTSDHGQNILEHGNIVTHCSKTKPGPSEGNVPLFIATSNEHVRTVFEAVIETKNNKTSQFEVFPTLLWALGYPEERIRDLYGISLKDRDLHPQLFYYSDPLVLDDGGWSSLEE